MAEKGDREMVKGEEEHKGEIAGHDGGREGREKTDAETEIEKSVDAEAVKVWECS